MSASTKNNILLLAEAIWARVTDDARKEVGVRTATFGVNGDVPRRDAARQFLTRVNGMGYLPTDTLAVEFEEKVNNLEAAHHGGNNFYNEPAHGRALLAIVPATGAIPDAVRKRYVKTVVLCKIGNGHGVSWSAQPSCDQMIAMMQEPEIVAFCRLTADPIVQGRMLYGSCPPAFKAIAQDFRDRTSNPHLRRALDLILEANGTQLAVLGRTSEMRRALAALD